MKTLLLVAHTPSENTQKMLQSVLMGARHPDVEQVRCRVLPAFEAVSEDVLAADAVILGTPENLGYMSGGMKDFFDRIYYPCLDRTDGLPYALWVRAGQDGTGTCRAVSSICGGMRWQPVQQPLVCRGAWQDAFLDACAELGLTVAAGLDTGVF